MGRAPCCDKANVKKGPWSPEEDARLKTYIEEHGTGGNWIALPHKIGLRRCGKSCRLRWLNYLRPNIKHGGFSEEEDNIICGLYISIGSRWSIIAAQLPGRTDNDIKNYWNTKLKKKLLGRNRKGASDPSRGRLGLMAPPPPLTSNVKEGATAGTFDGVGNSSAVPQPLSASAIERLQLHMQLHQSSPLSFYNNPALWPKLHPFTASELQPHSSAPTSAGQMMMLQPNHQQQQHHLPLLPADQGNTGEGPSTPALHLQHCSSGFSSADGPQQYSNNGFSSADVALQEELEKLLNSGAGKIITGPDGTPQLQLDELADCFKGTCGVVDKESVVWWGDYVQQQDHSADNRTERSSGSSSWDSATAPATASHNESILEAYMMGYGI